jgi:hypothetical protein
MSTDLNRRAILAGAASLPAASIPAIAAEPDVVDGARSQQRGAIG